MFKIDLSAVFNPQRVDAHTITGNLMLTEGRGEMKFEIKRYLRGWRPCLKIVVADVLVHDEAALDDHEKTAFSMLAARADSNREKYDTELRNRVRESAIPLLFPRDAKP